MMTLIGNAVEGEGEDIVIGESVGVLHLLVGEG